MGNRIEVLSRTLSLSVAFAVLWLMYCFHFNVDFTDESFYLYFFEQGPGDTTFNFYHIFIHYLGMLAGHKLIFYRYLSLLFIFPAAFLLSKCVVEDNRHLKWTVPMTLGLLYFNLLSTFSYNTVALVGGTFLLGLVYLIPKSQHKLFISFIIGLLGFLVFSARFAPGIFFLGLSLLAMWLTLEDRRERRNAILVAAMTFVLCFGLTLVLWWASWLEMVQIIKVISHSSHKGLIASHVKQALLFTPKSILPPLVLLLASKRWFKDSMKPILIYLGWLVIQRLVLDYDFNSFSYYFSGILFALVIVELLPRFHSRQLFVSDFVNFILPMAFFITSSVGSNNNFLKANCYNLILTYPVIHKLFFSRFTEMGRIIWGGLFSLLALVGIFKHQYWEYYRNPPRNQQVFVTSALPVLQGIKLDQEREAKLSQVGEFYSHHHYNPQLDRVVSYPNLPGYVSLFEAKALGTPWHINDYDRSSETNCSHINRAVLPDGGRVFLILEDVIPSMMEKCLWEKVHQDTSRILLLNV